MPQGTNLTYLLAQDAIEPTFWGRTVTHDSPFAQSYFWFVLGALVFMTLLLIGLARIQSNYRRPIVVSITFLAAMFWILEWLIPKSTAPDGRSVAMVFGQFNYLDAVPVVSRFSQILSGILLGLGVFSIFRLHFRRVFKAHKDWFFSTVLLLSMGLMIAFGFWKHYGVDRVVQAELMPAEDAATALPSQLFDIVFMDMWQAMDAAMFSLIAFFILSAAYRAFRIRSIEATIMMATALIVLLGFIPLGMIITNWLPADTFAGNFRIESVGSWILSTINTPALRAIDLGLGLGVLAMALRIMLGLERGVSVD